MSIDDIIQGIKDKSNLGDEASAGVDSITLREVTSTITTIGSALYGFIITIIIITVPILVAIELAYIVFPAFRGAADGAIDWLENKGIKVAHAGKKTLELTLRDAKQAVLEAETVKTGKSALAIYLVLKCKSIMFLAFVIALVLLGLGTIIDAIAGLFDGIITLLMDIIYAEK